MQTEYPDHTGRSSLIWVYIVQPDLSVRILLISSQSLNLGGRRGTTDDVATIPFHPSLSSAALRESPNPIPVHSLMLSSHLFFCLPLLLAPFTVPCRIVFAMPEELEMWPYHLSFRFFTMVRRSSCTPIAFWILLFRSLLLHLISRAWILLSISDVKVQLSQA